MELLETPCNLCAPSRPRETAGQFGEGPRIRLTLEEIGEFLDRMTEREDSCSADHSVKGVNEGE